MCYNHKKYVYHLYHKVHISYCVPLFELFRELVLVDQTLTALSVCLGVLVEMLNTTRVEGAGTAQNTMNLKEKETSNTYIIITVFMHIIALT